MQIKARWKRGKQSSRRNETVYKGGGRGGGGGELKLSAYFNNNLQPACMMQGFGFSSRCVTACSVCICKCLHACMCVCSSQEHLCMCKQMFCVSTVSQRSGPLHLWLTTPPPPSPVLFFHEHLFLRAKWVTPASQWRHRGIRSPYKLVAIAAGVVREPDAPYLFQAHPY